MNSGLEEIKTKLENRAKANTELISEHEELLRKMTILEKEIKDQQICVVQFERYSCHCSFEIRGIHELENENVFQ